MYRKIIFYIILFLLPLGQLLIIKGYGYGFTFLVIGLLFLIVYFIRELTIAINLKNKEVKIILIYSVLVLMTFTIYTKYTHRDFWDFPALLIIPIFLITAYFIIKKDLISDIKVKATTCLYLIFTIPLLPISFGGSPRKYIPEDWYNRYKVQSPVIVDLPYSFKFQETEDLSVKAFDLKKNGKLKEAIDIYKKALKLEPANPLIYFDLSECYALSNELELAKEAIDSAVKLDTTSAIFINNRGLLYAMLRQPYKAIKDYEKAIRLDSTNGQYYVNLSLVLFSEDLKVRACENLQMAEQLNYNTKDIYPLKKVINYCR